MSDERAFRGVWIPADIWLNRDLSMQEKVMLVEIDSLQSPTRGCYKSNKKLAEFFQLSPNRVSEIISSLAKKGLVRVEQVRNGKQIVERRIFMENPFDKPKRGTRDSEEGYSENGENPIRDSEEGYSENREERGSGLRGSFEGNPSLSDACEQEEEVSPFDRKKHFKPNGVPLTFESFAMTEDWSPESGNLLDKLSHPANPRMTRQEAEELIKEHGGEALERFITKHLSSYGQTYDQRVWHRHFADFLVSWHRNLPRQKDQNTASTTAKTGGNHANRQQRPRQYRSAQEARAAAQRAAGEQPAGSGQTFDGEWSPGER